MLSLPVKEQAIRIIAYFQVFKHPILTSELLSYLPNSDITSDELINTICKEQCLTQQNDYWGIGDNLTEQITQRQKKEERAKDYYKALPKYVRLISSFPYVRGVAISGSLSKGVMHEDGDIDYFIITEKRRLWVCRTLLILYKKVVLLNSRKYFCVNYFVDTENIEIQDKNMFTAVEIGTLIPVYGNKAFSAFVLANSWKNSYISTCLRQIEISRKGINWRTKIWIEKLFSGKVGDKLDLFFMKLSLKRWQNKFGKVNKETFDQTMRTKRGISKHHPSDFQTKVLHEFNENLKKINPKHEHTI